MSNLPRLCSRAGMQQGCNLSQEDVDEIRDCPRVSKIPYGDRSSHSVGFQEVWSPRCPKFNSELPPVTAKIVVIDRDHGYGHLSWQ